MPISPSERRQARKSMLMSGPAALQVPAEVEAAALAGLDDAVTQERHVRLALRRATRPARACRDTWR